MNPEMLLAHYERIAEAPDAIARLRRFVLDLAVRGKLVPPDPADEPASVLTGRVAQEWARLLREGAVREPTNAVRIPRGNLPFDAPARWSWARLIEIARPSYGFAFPSAQFNAERRGMPLIRIRDIANTDTEAYFDGDFDQAYVVRSGDYLVGMDGDFNLRRWHGRDALLNQRVMRVNGWRCGVDPEFIRLPLQFVLDHLHGQTSQTTVKHLSAKQVNGIEIPLPPLAEQHRIVAKVDELMALCDRLEAARTAREATRDRLAAASLARLNTPDPETFPSDARFALDALPALTTRPDQIKHLRQTILNLAVRGKLVPQHAGDEPASALLARIAHERARLAKARAISPPTEPRSTEDVTLLIEIPSHWAEASVRDVLHELQTGPFGSSLHEHDYREGGTPVINPASLQGGTIVPIPKMAIGADTLARLSTFRLRAGDIVMGRRGEMGRCALVTEREAGWLCGTGSLILRPSPMVFGPFLVLLIGSPFGREYLGGAAVGTTMQNLNQAILLKMRFGLPPLAEQRRIVAKADELMVLCDALEASLAAATTACTRLLDATLAEALAPAVAAAQDIAA